MKHLPLVGALAVALLSAGAVNAATPSTSPAAKPPAYAAPVIANADAMQGADQLQHTNLRQQLRDQLTKAGFTSVKIMPSSFYVQAKNKKGEPVAMVIGPDSFTAVTELPTSATTAQAKPQPSMQPKAATQK